ncbi:MAG: nucleotidyltransferase domain-containing protein [Patescibacteria group bacterium]|jgi:predicted nucleotidyltransferase
MQRALQPKNIILHLVDQLKLNREVCVIALVGSATQNSWDRWSDIDIFVVTDKRHSDSRMQVCINDRKVDVIFNAQKEIGEYLSKEKNSIRRNTAHLIANSKVLWQRKPIWSKLKKYAQEVLRSETTTDRRSMIMNLYSIDDYLAKAGRHCELKDDIAFGLASRNVIENSIEIFLKKYRTFWPPLSKVDALFKSSDPKFHRFLKFYYEKNTLVERYRALIKLADYASRLGGGPLLPNWSLHS